MPIVIKRKAPVPPPPPVQSTANPVPSLEPMDGIMHAAHKLAGDNVLVSWYLIASYAYYHHDMSILTNECFDALAKTLLAKWDDLVHQHKDLISRDELIAGTLFLAEENYPYRVKCAARHCLSVHRHLHLPIPEIELQTPES